MAEYIEREALENALEDENKNGNFVFTANWIMEIIDNLPAADVVPKSEVDGLNKFVNLLTHDLPVIPPLKLLKPKDKIADTKSEVAREIFEEIEKAITKFGTMPYNDGIVSLDTIAELKKKYTEEYK